MGIYGIDYYAGTRFGRDPSIVRPDFSVAPFVSLALDYRQLQLTWNRPSSTDCTMLQLVRNNWNLPQDETDGFLLFPAGWNEVATRPPLMDPLGLLTQYQPVGNQISFIDANAQSGWNYYTMFGWDSVNKLWIRCTDLITILPVNYSNGNTLYNLLPGCYRDLDMVLVDPYNPWAEKDYWTEFVARDTTPPLQRYLNLLGFQLDFLRTEIDTLLDVNNADRVSGALLPLLGYQLGMVKEPEIGMQQERALVGNAIHLYKLKGSGRGITEFSALLTSYPTMLAHKGYNLLLTRDDSVFETSVGTWGPSPSWGLWGPSFWSTLWAPPTPFPTMGSTNLGLRLTPISNLYSANLMMTDPISAFPPNPTDPLSTVFPADTLNPPYGYGGDSDSPTGLEIYVGEGCNVDISTGAIPTLDFLSEIDQPGNITWELQIWSPVTRTIQLSVWGDDGSSVPIQVVAPQSFTTTFEEWTRFRVTGPVTFGETVNVISNGTAGQTIALLGPYNAQRETVQVNNVIWHRAPGNAFANVQPTDDQHVYIVQTKGVPNPTIVFGDGIAGAIPPSGDRITVLYGHYDFLRPRLVIENMAAGEKQYITLCCAWATVPDNIGTYVPYYDYPRDIKVILEPQQANLLANPLTTFSHGLDGWGCTSNDPLNINNVITPQQWSFEGGTVSGFTAGPNTDIIPSSAGAEDGVLCLAMTAQGTGDISAISPAGIGTGWWKLAWDGNDAGGLQYQVRVNFQSSGTGRQCHVTYSWYDRTGAPLGTSTVGPITDTALSGTYCSGSITAPPGAVYLGTITPYVAACAAGETHYIDDVWVQGLPLWGELTVNQTSALPNKSKGALQVKVIEAPSDPPGCTVWGGTVTQFTPPPTPLAGWFVDAYGDWFGGNRYGTTKTMNWFTDPVSGQPQWSFVSGGSYLGVANSWMGGDWFPQPHVQQTANLVGFTAFPDQWLNFSIYAQALATSGPAMEFGFRWYYPDTTSIERVMIQDVTGTWQPQSYRSVVLSNSLQRYDVAGEAPYQPESGVAPNLVFIFCRFPDAQKDDLFLLNSALLSLGAQAPPFDDATLHPGSPDYVIDDKGSSFYYRRRAPRTARLRAEMYRWIPMGSTYSLEFGSSMTEPAYDPTTWPP